MIGLARIAGCCALATGVVGCNPLPPTAGDGSAAELQRSAAPTRIVIGMLGDPPALWDDINPSGGTVPGIGVVKMLVSSGLTVQDENGLSRPQLAEAVPTVENGLWKVFPDGQMEVSWRIREGARWHDGTPFTSADLTFTAAVGQDRDIAVFGTPIYNLVETIETPDPQSVTVKWRRPYIRADTMFSLGSGGFAPPIPRHILERPFREEKAAFLELPYWNTGFVSSGPFKVRDWAPSSHVVIEAFEQYVLGRPGIDQIEVRFITDPSTLVANVLAGALDLTLPRGITLEQGFQIREQWKEGRMGLRTDGWTMMYPQLRAPSPPAIAEPRFREALTRAINRQEMVDSMVPGSAVAHSIFGPALPEYAHVERSIARYDYDPRRAAQLIEQLGFARSADGFFQDGGRRLSVEIRTTTNDTNQKATFATADYWQRVGVGTEPVVIPVQQLQNREYRATYTGYELINQPFGASGFENLLHSSAAPLPERNYQAPNSSRNRGQYMNPEYDALMDQYRMTIPMDERMRLLGQLLQHHTELQLVVGLFYTAEAIMIANRLEHVPPASAWNAHEWRVR